MKKEDLNFLLVLLLKLTKEKDYMEFDKDEIIYDLIENLNIYLDFLGTKK